MARTRLSSKGQVIIPKAVRDARGWRAGQELIVEDRGDAVALRPARPFPPTTVDDLVGCTGYAGPRLSLEEMDAAIAEEARTRR
jgi:AbrB family looped-hinge helix DNA binding protein